MHTRILKTRVTVTTRKNIHSDNRNKTIENGLFVSTVYSIWEHRYSEIHMFFYNKAASKAKSHGLYAELQIATIKLKLGHFRDAKVALREILHEDPKYVPALKVMSECLLNEARDFLQQCIDKNVVDNCQEAITVLVPAIIESPK